jgi:signal transduction histidine kinase
MFADQVFRTDRGPGSRWRAWFRYVVRFVGLGGYVYSTSNDVLVHWQPGLRWLGFLVIAAGVVATFWIGLIRQRTDRQLLIAVGVLALSADILVMVNVGSIGWVITLVVCPWVVTRVQPAVAFRFVGVAIAVLGLVALVRLGIGGWETGWANLLGYVGGSIGTTSFGWSIRLMRERVTTAEQLLEQEKETRDATARAQVLDERSRLAREIHDILAHTLSAQTVELEGVRLMLKQRADPDEVLVHVDKAQRLARDGLAETRRALASLRGDVRPLPEAVRQLAADGSASLSIEEPVPELSPEVSIAVVRTIQEALTNTRKHAPGANVHVSLTFPPGACEAEITDTGARGTAPGALAESGGGYGLAGMAERAELLGGQVRAGPAAIGADGKGFRVWLRIPI